MSNIEKVSIAVTCHEKYFPYLYECLDSIFKQEIPFDEVILVYDGKLQGRIQDPRLKIFEGKWGTPNPARNLALKQCSNNWLVFFDGDDIIPKNYNSVLQQHLKNRDKRTAIYYANLAYFSNKTKKIEKIFEVPNWDYWELRDYNYIDTSSTWYKPALDKIGGWIDMGLDDYNLIMRVTADGWQCQKLDDVYVPKRRYEADGREYHTCTTEELRNSLWLTRSFALLTLLAGREHLLDKWIDWLASADLPPKISLYLLDNSKSDHFREILYDKIEGLKHRFNKICIHRDDKAFIHSNNYYNINKHKHVAYLYNQILKQIREDFVLTLEDDVCPPLDGFRKLSDEISCPAEYGVVGGAYQNPGNPDYAIGSYNLTEWEENIKWDELTDKTSLVGFLGGGFTLWANNIFQKSFPAKATVDENNNIKDGWDSNFCMDAKKLGYKIKLVESVKCQHFFKV